LGSLFAAAKVRAAGHGALAVVSEITGIPRSTINRGEDDLDVGPLSEGRQRRPGGGGKPLAERDATLVSDLEKLVEPVTLGDPVRPLIWVSKSLDKPLSKSLRIARRNNASARPSDASWAIWRIA
jgi:hypothetical protein